ncbi:MAG: hypothetical protein EBW37_09460 [Rhodobacteraceae bacterium]|nr:hypothetical protein [Paracoccaceae bacterium]
MLGFKSFFTLFCAAFAPISNLLSSNFSFFLELTFGLGLATELTYWGKLNGVAVFATCSQSSTSSDFNFLRGIVCLNIA